MKDKTTKNDDGSVTVVREMDPMDEMRHREEDAELDKLEAKINDPYPDSIPFDEFDQKPYADSVEPVDTRPTGADLEGDWMKPEVGKLRRENELLKAHLNSKGYGAAAIRRILAGEVVG